MSGAPHGAHPDEDATPATADVASCGPAQAPVLNILDAVCVIYFAASGQTNLLVDIIRAAGYRIFLPAEVLDEVKVKARRQKWNVNGLDAHIGAGPDSRIVVIDKITAEDSEAFTLLAQVRLRHPNAPKTPASAPFAATARAAGASARHADEDLGECVVVTHAVLAARRNLDVVVSIDDLKGQNLADGHNLTFFTVEDAISAGVEHEVLDTLGARRAYEKMIPFGSSLVTWDASELKPRLKREARARKEARTRRAGDAPAPRA